MSNQRSHRVAEQILQEASSLLLRGLRDPRIGFVTITGVDVTSDLQNAKIYFTVMGEEDQIKDTGAGLDSATPYIRRHLGKVLRLRRVPEIKFIYDTTLEQANRIDTLLREIGSDHGPSEDNSDD